MTDFLTRLAGRSMGLARVAEPVIPAMLLSAAPEAGPTAQNGDPVEAADSGRANALLPRPESESQGPRRMQASRSSMEGEAPHPPEGETARAHPSVEARRQSAPAEARTELAAAEHAPLFAEPVMAQVDRTIPSAEVPDTPAAAREVARHKTTVEREAAPTIRVTIGRVEVRAQFPSPKAERAPAAPPKPNALSLDDYLRQRQVGPAMSNYLAIATVTAALQQVLQTAVQRVVAGSSVGFSRPNQQDDQKTPLVNVYLYQVTPNTAYRNQSLPARRSDGTLVQRPQAALDLHYIFTFHGGDDTLTPQRLLGAVVTTLEAQPLLSRDDINNALTNYNFLKSSTLADQVERIKFTPTALSLEEFSKLWSVFFQVEYNLSAVYQASVVLMESDVTPQEAPPVQASNLYVVPFRWPQIDRVIAFTGADDPITAGSTLRIQGRQLRGADTVVLLEGTEWTAASVTDSEIVLPLPAGVHAGVQALQVAHRMAMGSPETPHRGFESNVVPFVLHPAITQVTAAADPASTPAQRITDINLQLQPNIGAGQRAVVVLSNPGGAPPSAYVSLPVVAAADTNTVTVPINGVPPGAYVVRVQIDGAESLLTMQGGVFSAPTVTAP